MTQRMDGLTRNEVDKAESKDFALGGKPMRPKDAATLILLDKRGNEHFVLIGRRHKRHAFMPGRFVFPGGRTDPTDSRIPVHADLHPAEAEKLTAPTRITQARAKAIAMSAVRETCEEAGFLIGVPAPFSTRSPHWRDFAENGIQPSLDRLRYIARAITPPGRVRRYDTRFLAAWRDDVACELPDGGSTDELEEIVWLPIADAMQAEIPAITRTILDDLQRRLADDPELSPGGLVPFYSMRGNRFVKLLT